MFNSIVFAPIDVSIALYVIYGLYLFRKNIDVLDSLKKKKELHGSLSLSCVLSFYVNQKKITTCHAKNPKNKNVLFKIH